MLTKGPSKVQNNVKDVFPMVNTLFGLHKSAMDIFWIESNVMKVKGKSLIVVKKGMDKIKTLVDDRVTFEYSEQKYQGVVYHLVKLGQTDMKSMDILKRFKANP